MTDAKMLEPFANELERQERVRNYRDGDCYLVDCRLTIGDLRRVVAATPEPCPYCSDGKRTGLPGNACENCMNTGLKYPERAATPAVGGEQQKGLTWGIGPWLAAVLEDPEIDDETKANIRAWLAESEEKAANIICGDVCQHPDICNGKEDTWCWKKVKEFSTATPAVGGEDLEENVAWAILSALHDDVPVMDRPQSWSDLNGNHEKKIRRAAKSAIALAALALPASPLRVQETCIECGKCDPCDYDCPNYIDDQPPSPLRDDALEEAAQYHDRNAADCRAIALVNLDNDLGADSKTHAVDHEIAAEDIRAMKGSPPEQPAALPLAVRLRDEASPPLPQMVAQRRAQLSQEQPAAASSGDKETK